MKTNTIPIVPRTLLMFCVKKLPNQSANIPPVRDVNWLTAMNMFTATVPSALDFEPEQANTNLLKNISITACPPTKELQQEEIEYKIIILAFNHAKMGLTTFLQ